MLSSIAACVWCVRVVIYAVTVVLRGGMCVSRAYILGLVVRGMPLQPVFKHQ